MSSRAGKSNDCSKRAVCKMKRARWVSQFFWITRLVPPRLALIAQAGQGGDPAVQGLHEADEEVGYDGGTEADQRVVR